MNRVIHRWLWVFALTTYVFGDLATTIYGLETASVYERNALARQILYTHGYVGLVVLKSAIPLWGYVYYRTTLFAYKVTESDLTWISYFGMLTLTGVAGAFLTVSNALTIWFS